MTVSVSRLILGFMVVTAFLSMWISNTATTAMMLPIAHAVLEQLHNTQADIEAGSNNPTFELQEPSPLKEETKLGKTEEPGTARPLNSSGRPEGPTRSQGRPPWSLGERRARQKAR